MTTEILKKLDAANEKLDTMLQWRAGLEERCKAHNQRTEEVRNVLFDNPDGLVSRVNILNGCKESLSRWRDFWMSILKVVVTAAIISLAGWLFYIYRDQDYSVISKDVSALEVKGIEEVH